MKIHEKYMNRAIQLGAFALGSAAPNPMVGAVIVYKDRILGEGYTSPYGGAHAEVNAINAVQDKDLLSKATLYVTLEPCSHYGKTPPCSDLIIKHSIPEVVIGIEDPSPEVAGQGLVRLKQAGCRVTTGVLERACREHHKRFLCFHEKKRPYIILKWAQSPDGFLAPEKALRSRSAEPHWISNKTAKRLVHQWRSQEQAILVGSTTIRDDNPRLNTRLWKGDSPHRFIIDKDLSLNNDTYHVLDTSVKTTIISTKDSPLKHQPQITYEQINEQKAVAFQICDILLKYHMMSVIVEGGAKTLQTFIDDDLWDEARIFTGSRVFGAGLKAPQIRGRQDKLISVGDNKLLILSRG